MKLRFLLLAFCFFTGALWSNAQMDQLRLGFTIQPLPLLEFYQGGNLRTGLQFRIAPQVFLHGEFGKYFNALNFQTENLKGYNWRAAIQYNYSAFYYVALDYFYKDHSFDRKEEIDLNGIISEKNYRLQKYSNAITFKWGKLAWTKNKRIYTDIYMGAGLRLRHVRQSELSLEEFQNIANRSIVYKSARKQGRIFSPEFSFGFRFGFAVFRKNT